MCVLAFFAGVFAGCFSTKSPYDHMNNWVICDSAVRSFAVAADVIYVQDKLFGDLKSVPAMHCRAKHEVGKGRFDGLARVFSPLVANSNDIELAMKWYFRNRDGDRPFVFIGEGEGGSLLKAYEEANSGRLKSDGLVGSFYSEVENGPFVTDSMVKEIRKAVIRYKYRVTWGREAPEGLSSE
jgi:hypothetical protein